jgi:hypothetical protein
MADVTPNIPTIPEFGSRAQVLHGKALKTVEAPHFTTDQLVRNSNGHIVSLAAHDRAIRQWSKLPAETRERLTAQIKSKRKVPAEGMKELTNMLAAFPVESESDASFILETADGELLSKPPKATNKRIMDLKRHLPEGAALYASRDLFVKYSSILAFHLDPSLVKGGFVKAHRAVKLAKQNLPVIVGKAVKGMGVPTVLWLSEAEFCAYTLFVGKASQRRVNQIRQAIKSRVGKEFPEEADVRMLMTPYPVEDWVRISGQTSIRLESEHEDESFSPGRSEHDDAEHHGDNDTASQKTGDQTEGNDVGSG